METKQWSSVKYDVPLQNILFYLTSQLFQI